MKKVIINWKSITTKGHFVGISYEINGFFVKKCIQVTESKYSEIPETGELELPAIVLA